MTMTGMAARRNQFQRDAILHTSPARLLTMLYDRLLLDLQRAEIAQQAEDWNAATAQLLHTQDIVAELKSSLDLDAWDGAENLLGLYNFVARGLVHANIHRDIGSTRTAIELLEPLRQTWHEAAASVEETQAPVQRDADGSLGVA